MLRPFVLFASASMALSVSPAMAEGGNVQREAISEPAKQAVPINVDGWKRQIVRDFPSLQRFYGLPEMKLGLIVSEQGAVTSCLALPLGEGEPARGQGLCPLLEKHARFEPALDESGNPIRSVFIAEFGKSRPVNAISGPALPAN